MSDEAMEVERMLQRWLKTYGGVGGDANQMASWFRDYFDNAFQWALSHQRAVETTKGGVLDSALSHLRLGPGSKVEFMAGLCRGIGSNMNTEVRNQFYNDMARWAAVTGSPGVSCHYLRHDNETARLPCIACALRPVRRLSGEGGILDVGTSADPLAVLGEELRERDLGGDEGLVITRERGGAGWLGM